MSQNLAVFYRNLVFKRLFFIFIATVLCAIFFVFDVILGPAKYTLNEILQTIFTHQNANLRLIVFDMRIPCALLALIVGASLGLSGAVIQTILQNPLASPYTLGIGSAASFGAAVGIVLGGEFLGLGAFAFLFSLISIFFIYYLSKHVFLGSSSIILIGIILVFLYQSLQAFVLYLADESEISSIVFWTFGSLQKATYDKFIIIFIAFLITLAWIFKNIWRLNALLLGDEKAASFGINVSKLKITALILISLLTTICICFVGTIGFVGLVAPHIARLLVGGEQRFFSIFSALIGACLLSFASILSKILINGVIFPIGIITSFIGAICFLSIVLKKGFK